MAAVRQQINIAAPARTVWQRLTTSEGMAAWWADEARVDARVGGRVVLVSEDDEGNPQEERGIFHELVPTRKVEIMWDTGSKSRTRGSRVQFAVARDGDETRVSVVHSGLNPDIDDEERDRLDVTWRRALQALRDSLES